MPEGPELHLASRFVNRMCEGVVFSGTVEKSEVSKSPDVPFSCDAYRITATSRGKEVRLTLTPIKSDDGDGKGNQQPMDVVFRFGMSGFFRFTEEDALPKHSHLRFYTKEKPHRVLSFVDMRRFGRWEPNGTWQTERGPCILFEYESFRQNVLSSLSDKAFDRPICEALLNQKYFNGIGNYLRAEILYRLRIPPFVKARSVLEGLDLQCEDEKKPVKEESPAEISGKTGRQNESQDLLSLCHTIPLEVLELGGKGYDPDPEKADYTDFKGWLQCYYVDGMNSLRDHNSRTIWFKGEAGPMAPKGSKSPNPKRKLKKEDHDYTNSSKVAKKKRSENVSKGKPVKPRAEAKALKKVKREIPKQNGPKRKRSVSKGLEKDASAETKPKARSKNSPAVRQKPSGPKRKKGKNGQELSSAKENTRPNRGRKTNTAEPKRRSERVRRQSSRN